MALIDFKDGVTFTGLSADTAAFSVLGGRYGVGVTATFGGGSITLKVLMPDGSSYVTCLTPFTAEGVAIVDLPPGVYKFVIATATAVQGFLVPLPVRDH